MKLIFRLLITYTFAIADEVRCLNSLTDMKWLYFLLEDPRTLTFWRGSLVS